MTHKRKNRIFLYSGILCLVLQIGNTQNTNGIGVRLNLKKYHVSLNAITPFAKDFLSEFICVPKCILYCQKYACFEHFKYFRSLLLKIWLYRVRCSHWKLSKVNGCRTETEHFWRCIGKAKIHLWGRNCYIFDILFGISAVCLQFFKNFNASLRILAVPTQGQKCTVSVLQPFTFDNFYSKHHVVGVKTLDKIEFGIAG